MCTMVNHEGCKESCIRVSRGSCTPPNYGPGGSYGLGAYEFRVSTGTPRVPKLFSWEILKT